MTQQHYRVTLEQAIAHYQAGDLTAKGLLHFYIKIKLKPGWKVRLDPKEICQELGIGKTAFYNSISRLKAEGSIDWEAPEGILVSISSSFRECRMVSLNAESQFASAEKESSQPLSVEQSGDPPNSLANSYQIFSKSLSEDERERFFYFVKQQIKNFREPIKDLEAWLASQNAATQNRWEVYYSLFQSSHPSKARNEESPCVENSDGSKPPKRFSLREEIEQQRQRALAYYARVKESEQKQEILAEDEFLEEIEQQTEENTDV